MSMRSLVIATFTAPLVLLAFSSCRGTSDQVDGDAQKLLTEWVGNEACARCHQTIHDSYNKTGMGRSFPRLDVRSLAATITFGQPVHDASSGFSYVALLRDSQLVMREYRMERGAITYMQERVAAYQIGSANQTISFIERQGGFLFEMPLTWYSGKKQWDMSPGYEGNNMRFDRPINSTCMNCHNGPSVREASTENFFTHVKQGIGCESCHGPGKRHSEAADRSPEDKSLIRSTIRNSPRWSRDVQMDLCQRCHLEGLSVWNDGIEPHMVEPGEPLARYKAVFATNVSHEDESAFNIAAQADRLRKSACYVKSGTMTCTTCHDPHTTSTTMQKKFFNNTCLSCHAGDDHSVACSFNHSVPEKARECVSCHMSIGETSDIPHVSYTDHYIRRTPQQRGSGRKAGIEPMRALVPMIHAADLRTQLQQRGIAYFEFHQTQEQKSEYLDSAITLLASARAMGAQRQDGEDDYVAGTSLNLRGRTNEAEAALRRAIERNPQHARALYMLGSTLSLQGRLKESAELFRRAISVQPRLIESSLGLGRVLLSMRDPLEASKALLQAVAYDSLSYPELHFSLAQAHQQMGDLTQAERRLEKVLQLQPGFEPAHEGLIEIAVRRQDWPEVLKKCDEVLKRNPLHVPTLLNKSTAYWNIGKKRDAMETARSVLLIDPENTTARSFLKAQ